MRITSLTLGFGKYFNNTKHLKCNEYCLKIDKNHQQLDQVSLLDQNIFEKPSCHHLREKHYSNNYSLL